MLQVSLLTLQNVGTLLVYIAIGYLLRRSGKLPANASKVLSTLTTTLILPIYTANSLSQNFTLEKISSNLGLLGCGVAFALAAICIGLILAKVFARSDFERSSLRYAFTFPNYGYFGYPLIEGVFGAAMRANAVVFAIPLSIATHTYGYLQFAKEKKLSVKRVLLIPTTIGTAVGIARGLSGLKLPAFCTSILSGIGGCMSPISMILGGIVLGNFPLGKLLSGARAYLYSGIRLLGIPILFTGILYVCGVRGIYLMLPSLFSALPLGMNLVVFPESYGIDASDNARTCFISYLLAAVLLPVSYGIISSLAGF